MTFTEELTRQGIITEKGLGDVMRIANEKYDGSLERALIEKGVPEDRLLDIKSTFFKHNSTKYGFFQLLCLRWNFPVNHGTHVYSGLSSLTIFV